MCGVLDATYALRYDWALESDRMAAMQGAETTFVEDFLQEIEAPAVAQTGEPSNITDIREWGNYVNRTMTGPLGG